MTASPAIGWICDHCGNPITSIEDGRVEWLACDGRGKPRVEGLRLVHARAQSPKSRRKNGCQYDARREFHDRRCLVGGLSLERFVGPDGLMLLLSFMAAGETPKDEILELIKRVQIPGYEQASPYFQEAINRGLIVPSIGNGYFLQSEIRVLLRHRAEDQIA